MENTDNNAINNQQTQQPIYQGQPQYQQPIYYQPYPIQPKKKSKALGIIGFIIGVAALILGLVMGAYNVGIAAILGIIGIVINIIGTATGRGRGLAIAGLIMSVLGIACAVISTMMYF